MTQESERLSILETQRLEMNNNIQELKDDVKQIKHDVSDLKVAFARWSGGIVVAVSVVQFVISKLF